MRKRILVLLAALFWAHAAAAQGIPAADGAAIRAVIDAQLDAFRARDGERAFAFADANIRAMFGDAATFMRMVREGYAPIYSPRAREFGAAEDRGDTVAQAVEIEGADGSAVLAIYEMRRLSDGTFRIAGVSLLRSRRPGV
jgi:hypothetical protein